MRKLFISLILVSCFLVGCQNSVKGSVDTDTTDKTKEEVIINNDEEIKENNIIKEDTIINSEEEVVLYFENVQAEVNTLTNEKLTDKIADKLKNTFITITDFLFYDGKIGGVTFNELSDETKLKVLTITSLIDEKIESKLPGYKDTIKTTTGKIYSNTKEMIQNGITNIKDYAKEKIDEDTYNSLEEDLTNLKDNFKNATEVIKDAGSNVKDEVKDWYEKFRDNKE